jgi:hypothetical protein
MTTIDQPTEAAPDPLNVSDASAARGQLALSCLGLFLIVLAVVFAQVMMRNDQLLLRPRVRQWKQNNGAYYDRRYYESGAERELYNVFPEADLSHPGVFFFGTSPTEEALLTWAFPSALRPHVQNLCMQNMRHEKQFELLRCLVEQQGLLSAGPQNDLVVLELTFASATHANTPAQRDLERLNDLVFTRFGLYKFTSDRHISVVPMAPIVRDLKIISLRTHVFWAWMLRRDVGYFSPQSTATATERRDYWSQRMGPDWQTGMNIELEQLGQMVDYLKARHVNVAAVYFPEQSWQNGFSPAEAYRKKVMAMMAAKSVPVTDLIHAVPDGLFADSVHLNYKGAQLIQHHFIELTERHLKQHGVQ